MIVSRSTIPSGGTYRVMIPGHWRIATTYKLFDCQGNFLGVQFHDVVRYVDVRSVVKSSGPDITVDGVVVSTRFHPLGFFTSEVQMVVERISGPSNEWEEMQKEKLKILGEVGS